jgi:hypothetical protein
MLMRWIETLMAFIFCAVGVLGAAGQLSRSSGEWIQEDCAALNRFNAVWGASREAVYAVGANGAVVQFDGRSCRPQVNGTFDSLFAVWGTSATDIWAVGERGTIVHSSGGAWRLAQINPSTENDLAAVWGSSSEDVFAVGENGTILHYDGVSWKPQASGTNAQLEAIWGTSSRNVYAVGSGATLLHYDGAQWSAIPVAVDPALEFHGLWGATDTALYVAGRKALIISGSDPENNYTVWRGVVLYVNAGRQPPAEEVFDLDDAIDAVHVTPDGDAYLSAPSRRVLHLVGRDWTVISESAPAGIRSLWKVPTGEFFAVGIFNSIAWLKP